MKPISRLAFAATLAALLAAARADSAPPGPGTYVFALDVAPVCMTGTFPVTVTTDAGVVSGSFVAAMDAVPKFSGTLSIGGSTLTVSGALKSTSKGETFAMTSDAPHAKLSFTGSLANKVFTGTVAGKGAEALFPGKHAFTMDVGDAPPLTASFVADIVAGKHGALSGTGTATVCDTDFPLKGKASSGKSFRFSLARRGLKFSASGSSSLAWKFTGVGVAATGAGLALTPLPPPTNLAYGTTNATFEEAEPIEPLYPTSFMPPLTTYSIVPDLPAGLAFDAATGVISGGPQSQTAGATYTITATNPAGSAHVDLYFDVRINRSKSFAVDADPLSDDDLRHFLRRTQWGVRSSELTALHSESFSAYVDAMLAFPGTTTAETNANALLVHATDPPTLQGDFPTTNDLARWWLQIMADTPAPFQEELAFFWHDHFGVSSANMDGSERRFLVTHVNLLRHEGNGNLRTLLLDVAKDPAMLLFLSGVQNVKGKPNENFAREFWELFSLGVDNGYTQADITEAARAWTGYQETSDAQTGLNSVAQVASRHDTGSKTFLGVTIPANQTIDQDYASVVDATIQNRRVAEYVVKSLFEWFVYEGPPQSLIDTMAADLRAKNYELTPFLKSLFTSEAFFSKKARRALVKNPVDFTMGFIRTTGLRMTTSSSTSPALDVAALDTSLTNQGQRPTQPPTVAGWPSGDLWLSAQNMVERINVVHQCVDDTTDQARVGIDVANLLPPVAQRTADAVVDTLASLLDVQLSTQDRSDLITYLDTQRDASGNVTSSPFDGSSQIQLDERVRGLLYILAQHPTYHSR